MLTGMDRLVEIAEAGIADATRAHTEGANAFRSGKKVTDNPYLDTRDMVSFRAWFRGHKSANLAALKVGAHNLDLELHAAQNAYLADENQHGGDVRDLLEKQRDMLVRIAVLETAA